MAYSREFLEEMAKAQDVFVWEAPSWEQTERNPKWYLWLGLATFVLAAYAIFTQNYLFAFIVLLLAIILVLAGNEAPHAALVQIGHQGVVYDDEFYLFNDLHNFAIVYQPPEIRVLYVQPKSVFKPRMRIELGEEDPVAIRMHLKRYVDEDSDLRDEHLSDIVGRLLKL